MQRLTPKEAAQIIGYSVSTMKHFLRDVLAGFLASLLAALVAHMLTK